MQGLTMLATVFPMLIMLSTASSAEPVRGRVLQPPLPSNSSSSVNSSPDRKVAAGSTYWCAYTVEIETSCAFFAGTDDPVSVRFGDKSGRHVMVNSLVSRGKKDFERCHLDTFRVRGPCLRNVCFLFLKRNGHDDWRPAWARVFYGGVHSQTFTFRKFIPSGAWYGFDYCS